MSHVTNANESYPTCERIKSHTGGKHSIQRERWKHVTPVNESRSLALAVSFAVFSSLSLCPTPPSLSLGLSLALSLAISRSRAFSFSLSLSLSLALAFSLAFFLSLWPRLLSPSLWLSLSVSLSHSSRVKHVFQAQTLDMGSKILPAIYDCDLALD